MSGVVIMGHHVYMTLSTGWPFDLACQLQVCDGSVHSWYAGS